MNEDIVGLVGFFFTAIVIVIGLPLVRAYTRRLDHRHTLSPGEAERDHRLARIEMAVESMAVEIERISEGQRFVTKLLAERERPGGVLPSRDLDAR